MKFFIVTIIVMAAQYAVHQVIAGVVDNVLSDAIIGGVGGIVLWYYLRDWFNMENDWDEISLTRRNKD